MMVVSNPVSDTIVRILESEKFPAGVIIVSSDDSRKLGLPPIVIGRRVRPSSLFWEVCFHQVVTLRLPSLLLTLHISTTFCVSGKYPTTPGAGSVVTEN